MPRHKEVPKFDDLLKLDVTTMMDHFKIDEVALLLTVEPYNKETQSNLYTLMMDFVEEEEYLWCAMIKKELERREELTVI